MRSLLIRSITLFALVALVVGCTPATQEDAGEEVAEEPAAAAMPDTTADAVWAHLQQEDYKTWPMFPGKGELYEGQEPHGALLTTHVNELALDAFTNGAAVHPTGAMIVKENYMPDQTLAAVTVMYKTEGFDPGNNNWWWMKRLADGTVETSGRSDMCIACHGTSANDYIMTALPE